MPSRISRAPIRISAVSERLAVALQYALPKRLLTQLAGKLAGLEGGKATTAVIRWFAKRYGVNMAEAANADPASYASFNQFFTRPLREGVRPIADADFVCPVDGAISQFGPIEFDQVFQAKGHFYSTTALVGGDRALAARFENGDFATIYLSPRDYHRFHSPLEGRVTGYSYLPGAFWPVNQASVKSVDALFAINERLVTWLDTSLGHVAYIAVGATCVSRIHAAYDAVVTHTGAGQKVVNYERPIPIAKGGEIGMFEMGSTVILLFQKGKLTWDPTLKPDVPVRLGQRIATRT